MTGCAAINCSRNSRRGLRMFRFPCSPRRRAKWLQNSRRGQWTPKFSSRLCEIHFEESQYEDFNPGEGGVRKLRHTAVPTLFDIPNPPQPLQNKRKRTANKVEVLPVESASSQFSQDHCYFKTRKLSNTKQKHFEQSQYENFDPGEGGVRKLRMAGPMLFDVLNLPQPLQNKRKCTANEVEVPVLPVESTSSQFSQDHCYFKMRTLSNTEQNELLAPVFGSVSCQVSDWVVEDVQICQDDESQINNSNTEGEAAPNVTSLTETDPQSSIIIENIPSPGCSKEIFTEKMRLQQHVWRLQKQLARSRKEVKNTKEKLNKSLHFLSEEQRRCFLNGKKVFEYSPECIKEALQTRHAVGAKGYKFLVQRGFPLPSYSTICRRLQTADFMPGLLTDNSSCLKMKSNSFSEIEKDCVLQIDDMKVSKGVVSKLKGSK